MKKYTSYLGLFLIIIGTSVLLLTRLPSLSNSNAMLLSGLVAIVAGIWLHIRHIKHQSGY